MADDDTITRLPVGPAAPTRPRTEWHPSFGGRPPGPRPHRPAPPRAPGPRHLHRRRPAPGEMPAYRVLAIMVAGLLLAAVVNADALVKRAEHKPLGASRDRSLLLWDAVATIGHVTQLTRIRDLADLAAGDDGAPSAPVASIAAPADPTGAPAADSGPPTVRTPTPTDRLRLLVVGDSVARDFGESLVAKAEATGLLDPSLDYRIATGFARPDYFDWPSELRRLVAGTPPDVVVALFGANDSQGMLLADGTALQSPDDPRWQAEYASRVGAAMDSLRAPGRLVLWVGQPLMRDGGFSRRMDLLDGIYQQQAATRPWVQFLDARPVLAGPGGGYADRVTTPSGQVVDLRQGDGIHLARGGADVLADAVLEALRAQPGLQAL